MNSLSPALWFKSSTTDSLRISHGLRLIFWIFSYIETFQSCFRDKDQSWRCFVSYCSIENFKRYNFSSDHICRCLFSERRSGHFVEDPTRTSIGQLAHRNLRLTFHFRMSDSKESSGMGLFIAKWLGRLDQSALCEISKHWFWPEIAGNRVRKHNCTISSRIHRNVTENDTNRHTYNFKTTSTLTYLMKSGFLVVLVTLSGQN